MSARDILSQIYALRGGLNISMKGVDIDVPRFFRRIGIT